MSCCCGRQGFGERQRGTTCTVWRKLLESSNFLHTEHVVQRCGSPNPCLPQQQDTIPYAVKISVLRTWRWAKDCPKHVELILEINKLLLLHLVGFSILLYLHWRCTVKHKSNKKPSGIAIIGSSPVAASRDHNVFPAWLKRSLHSHSLRSSDAFPRSSNLRH